MNKNIKNNFLILVIIFNIFSCTKLSNNNPNYPSWYLQPKNNSHSNIYGLGQGYDISQATKAALANAASRLFVTISSKSTLINQENNFDALTQIEEKIIQNIENISFNNYQISNSTDLKGQYFIEVKINRQTFIEDYLQRLDFLEKKIAFLDKNSKNKNKISRRNALIKILNLSQELEIKSRILKGAKEEVNLEKKLQKITQYQNEFDKISDKIEIFFSKNSPIKIRKILQKKLTSEGLKISQNFNPKNQNQILVKITINKTTKNIYDNFITNSKIHFENIINNKIIASNSIEVSSSSVISAKQSYLSSLKNLEKKLQQENSFKILGLN